MKEISPTDFKTSHSYTKSDSMVLPVGQTQINENPEADPLKYIQLIVDRDAKVIQCRKQLFHNKRGIHRQKQK